MPTRPRVLCVDDERMVTEALTLHLQRAYEVTAAESGSAGLQAIERGPPFAVVLSDMRMPGMSGAEFLAEVRARAPRTARILLTGHSDMQAAIAAVNQGGIFRFLAKPCAAKIVLETVREGVEQHRLAEAEKELLEQTLAGSVKVLTELLALSSPLAFGRASRVGRRMEALCDALGAGEQRWAFSLAASLYHVGFVSLPDAVAEKVYYGQPLEPADQALVDGVAAVSDQLLAHIPRLAPVREIIAATPRRFDGAGQAPSAPRGEALPLGARMLRLVLELDALEAAVLPLGEALRRLALGAGTLYDPAILQALGTVAGHAVRIDEVRPLPVSGLRPGMVLAEDLRLRNGTLLVAREFMVTASLVSRLRNIAPGNVVEPVLVHAGRGAAGGP